MGLWGMGANGSTENPPELLNTYIRNTWYHNLSTTSHNTQHTSCRIGSLGRADDRSQKLATELRSSSNRNDNGMKPVEAHQWGLNSPQRPPGPTVLIVNYIARLPARELFPILFRWLRGCPRYPLAPGYQAEMNHGPKCS